MIHLSGFPLTLTQVTAKLTNTDTGAVLLNTSAEPENGTYGLQRKSGLLPLMLVVL